MYDDVTIHKRWFGDIISWMKHSTECYLMRFYWWRINFGGGCAWLMYLQVCHDNDVIMSATASQNTGLTIVYSTVYSRRRSKKTPKLRVTGLCAGNSPVHLMTSSWLFWWSFSSVDISSAIGYNILHQLYMIIMICVDVLLCYFL